MPTILVVSAHRAIARGLESVLNAQPDLHILGCETDPDRAPELIHVLQPEVVVVSSEDPLGEPLPAILRLLRSEPNTSVIGLNLCDNTICICPGNQSQLAGPEGLLKAIRLCG